MPCRFYESGYFGVPCLAVRDFQVGSVVEQHGIGFTFDKPLEERLISFFETLTVADYERICAELGRMPDDMFVAGDDVSKLCGLIDSFSWPRSIG
jgi:succinoglycan biosynthesis protein ExoL